MNVSRGTQNKQRTFSVCFQIENEIFKAMNQSLQVTTTE